MMHGMVEGVTVRGRGKKNLAHRHCRVDSDCDYSMFERLKTGRRGSREDSYITTTLATSYKQMY